MFKQQEFIISSLPDVRTLLRKYHRPEVQLESVERLARHFAVRVPLVGAFSCGKSSLLNALIGERLFATSIDPQTAVPAELKYAANPRYAGCHADGRREMLSREAIAENQLDSLVEGGWVEVELPSAELAKLPHLRLVDMPGWDSGNDRHAAAIDNYASRSLAYCVVVGAEEGTLHESIRAALAELKLSEMPVIAIISKCDKLLPESVDAIAEQVRQEIEKLMGKPPFCLARVSARQNRLDEFILALAQLEQQSEPLFAQTVGKAYLTELTQLEQYLQTLLNRDDLDSAQVEIKRQELVQEMQNFQNRLDEETRRLDSKLPHVLSVILERIQSELNSQIDSMVDLALQNGNLRPRIEQLIRKAVTLAIREEFQEELKRYFDNVAESLPQHIQLDLKLPDRTVVVDESDEKVFSAIKWVATSALTVLLGKIPMVAAVVIPLVHKLIDLFRSDNEKELAAAQRRETVCQQLLHSIFPQVIQSTENVLRPKLEEQVKEAKAHIARSVQAQMESMQAALNELDKQLAQGKSAFASASQQFESDLHFIENLQAQLRGLA